jgi:hypothetical protein
LALNAIGKLTLSIWRDQEQSGSSVALDKR